MVAGATEKAMGGERKDALGSLSGQDIGCLAKGPGGIDHIVDDDAIAASHFANKIHLINRASSGALLDDHGKADIMHVKLVRKTLFELFGTVHAACIGANDDQIVQIFVTKVFNSNHSAVKIVHWDAGSEEALNLATVQVDGNYAIDTHRFEETGNIGSRYGDASLFGKMGDRYELG